MSAKEKVYELSESKSGIRVGGLEEKVRFLRERNRDLDGKKLSEIKKAIYNDVNESEQENC